MSTDQSATDWQTEYEFYNKIIVDEVARRRFNDGFEPIDAELYRYKNNWVATTRICHRDFAITAWPDFDATGRPILKLKIRSIKRPT
jgi:hypothetical protein